MLALSFKCSNKLYNQPTETKGQRKGVNCSNMSGFNMQPSNTASRSWPIVCQPGVGRKGLMPKSVKAASEAIP